MNDTNQATVMDFVTRNIDTIPFKTLRHGEVELPQSEQLTQMKATLHNDPALFLSKWGRYLSQNTLRSFQAIQGNYEVDFYLNSLLFQPQEESQPSPAQTQAHKKSAMQLLAHNRRYEFLQRELRGSDYFLDESIQLREPILYDQFIGQYIPAREKTKPFDNEMTLVNRIFSNMDRKFVDDHLYEQKIRDIEQFEEEEEEEGEDGDEEEEGEDGDEEEDVEMEKSTPAVLTKKKNKDTEMEEAASSDGNAGSIKDEDDDEEEEEDTEAQMEFREEQRSELIRLLEEKFLSGKDEFDYDQVDFNEDYDDLHQLEQDIHDRYFDEDD